MTKHFKCNLCNLKDQKWMTRKGLRKHLKEKHGKRMSIMNKEINHEPIKLEKQDYWREEEI